MTWTNHWKTISRTIENWHVALGSFTGAMFFVSLYRGTHLEVPGRARTGGRSPDDGPSPCPFRNDQVGTAKVRNEKNPNRNKMFKQWFKYYKTKQALAHGFMILEPLFIYLKEPDSNGPGYWFQNAGVVLSPVQRPAMDLTETKVMPRYLESCWGKSGNWRKICLIRRIKLYQCRIIWTLCLWSCTRYNTDQYGSIWYNKV